MDKYKKLSGIIIVGDGLASLLVAGLIGVGIGITMGIVLDCLKI